MAAREDADTVPGGPMRERAARGVGRGLGATAWKGHVSSFLVLYVLSIESRDCVIDSEIAVMLVML